MPAEKVITPLAEDSPRKTVIPSLNLPAVRPPETEIRIHRDGLLIAKCKAVGMGPSRLFADIDPLHYPVNSRLELEFVNSKDHSSKTARMPATVTSRSIKGIVLRLDPAPAN
ncbi:MAG: hypothetical protein DRQ45_07585 [Gammaproteobacteria bacterium]|nr:MAG: hypothetical protein DRQ45_07585 [Gammaproteobacteria bacterium]